MMPRILSQLRSRTSALLAVLVAGTLVLSGCSIYDAPLPGGPKTGDNPMKVTVMFRDVLDLVPQSTVKVDDVSVGKVTKVSLKGYVAKVTVALPRNVDLPDNAEATIRQTSLLGEKFVSLAPPRNPSSGKLSDGDVIGLDRTGRNPEVEEVFGALALLLNGGGVGQLKTIASELNNAFGGRESDVRSVLDQIRLFTTQLDQNKSTIVSALENTNRLAGELRKQEGTIKSTLDDVPGALASVNRQRDDLVKMLKALTRLSGVGVRVIQASKASTINSLRELAPVLTGFADAGQSLPKAFQVYLTYPFVDDAVGRDPQVARNLHMGDFTNLSVNLNVDLANLPKLPTGPIGDACKQARDQVIQNIQGSGLPQNVKDQLIAAANAAPCNALGDPSTFISNTLATICKTVTIPGVCGAGALPTAVPSIPGIPNIPIPTALPNSVGGLGQGLGLPRAQLNHGYQVQSIDPFGLAAKGYDPGVGTLLFQGVATQR